MADTTAGAQAVTEHLLAEHRIAVDAGDIAALGDRDDLHARRLRLLWQDATLLICLHELADRLFSGKRLAAVRKEIALRTASLACVVAAVRETEPRTERDGFPARSALTSGGIR